MPRDRLGRPESLTAHAGRPQVVPVSSARRPRRLKKWEAGRDRRQDDVHFLRVTDVSPTRDDVTSRVREHVFPPVRVREGNR